METTGSRSSIMNSTLKEFAMGSFPNVFLMFSQFYVEHDLKKKNYNTFFFANRLIFMS